MKQRLLELINKGLTNKQISTKTSFKSSYISMFVKNHIIDKKPLEPPKKPPGRPKKYSQEVYDYIEKMFDDPDLKHKSYRIKCIKIKEKFPEIDNFPISTLKKITNDIGISRKRIQNKDLPVNVRQNLYSRYCNTFILSHFLEKRKYIIFHDEIN